MDDGAGGKDLGVEELDGAGAGGAKQGLAASLDDGGGADPVLVEQVGRGEGVGQLAGAPDEEVAAFGLKSFENLYGRRPFRSLMSEVKPLSSQTRMASPLVAARCHTSGQTVGPSPWTR